jgi:hypothetical protein
MAKEQSKLLASTKKWLEKIKGSNDDTKPVSVALAALERLLAERAKIKAQLASTNAAAEQAAETLSLALKNSKKAIKAQVVAEPTAVKPQKTKVNKPSKPDNGEKTN